MNTHDLENLYRSTEEDMRLAIGLVALPGSEPTPILQIHYRDWPGLGIAAGASSQQASMELSTKPPTAAWAII
ncbi:MAG: hypothetical protein JSV19_00015 [Phycisphaerales bacterium]|nr:MAG: hypothetical protein JSV19_00015 [Phycisphaerales bacterium]